MTLITINDRFAIFVPVALWAAPSADLWIEPATINSPNPAAKGSICAIRLQCSIGLVRNNPVLLYLLQQKSEVFMLKT